ncbi:MAG: hypothetical protein ACRD3V_27465 [Vicinamibacteria bacterium]
MKRVSFLERAVLGFSAHTGWAASVVVSGPLSAPRVVDRRRIRLAESDDTVQAEAYHRAAVMKPAAAERFVLEAARSATAKAAEALRALCEGLSGSYALVGAGIVAGGGKLPMDLEAILRSHALIHAAEGELYRGALSAAAGSCGLEVIRAPRREIPERLASSLEVDVSAVRDSVNEMGRIAGPPWARDQKEAAMTALLALAAVWGPGDRDAHL